MPILSTLRRHRKKSIAAGVILALLIGGIAFAIRPRKHQYVTAQATVGDLRQTVEAVGTVTSEKDLSLRFRTTGLVSQVNVKEGDHVHAGQVLAALRAGALGASVESARASVSAAAADLQALEEGTRPEDIAVAQADLEGKEAALQVAQTTLKTAQDSMQASKDKLAALTAQLNVNVSGQVALTQSNIEPQFTATEQAIVTVTQTFANNDIQDAIVKQNPGGYNDLQAQLNAAAQGIADARSRGLSASDYDSAVALYQLALAKVLNANTTVARAYVFTANLQPTSYLTVAKRQTYTDAIAKQKTSIDNAVTALQADLKSLQDLAASQQTQIATERANQQTAQGAVQKAQSDILTYQTAIQSAQAQLDLKKAGSRPTDIQAAQARLAQAQASLDGARASLEDTVITAPTDGTITQVDVKVGEISPTTDAITMLGSTPYRVETFLSEVDIPNVQMSQSGAIQLDAFPGIDYKLHVSEVDPAQTLVDNVAKYRVKLDFDYPHEEFKVGMTGDVRIQTGEKSNVVKIPGRAVIDGSSGSGRVVRILGHDGSITEQPVTIGMQGESGEVEVTEGLKGGETVVLLIK